MTKSMFTQAARFLCCLGGILLSAQISSAQIPASNYILSEADEPLEAPPLDDFVERKTVVEHAVLPYQPIREADILWERRIWRVIDLREKMNLAFAYPEAPFAKILKDAALAGDIKVYETGSSGFGKRLTTSELEGILYSVDTVPIFDPEDYSESIQIVKNELDMADIKRFRLKESWFFDKNTGTMQVRILAIAPMQEVFDSEGNFRYEKPLFWVHYPSIRPFLARHRVMLPGDNMATTLTWEDLLEMRYFASTIYKENNQYDRRIEDYLTGIDVLMEADKIKNEIFNFEQDVWQK